MKKIFFFSFVCILLVALVLPAVACKPGGVTPENVIKVGIIGPMTFPEGEHQFMGATMAAEKVNNGGGIKIGDKTYTIQLIKADSNEVLSTTDAATAMEKLITVDKAQFVYGGFRTEAVYPMQDVAMDYKTIFWDYGAATTGLCKKVVDDYDRYKYFFKGTPFNDYYLVTNTFLVTKQIQAELKSQLGITKVRAAIIAEKLAWTEGMISLAKAQLPAMGMEVVGVWQPSDTATDVNAALTAIAAKKPHLIFCIFSGPVGISYAKQAAELQIPACSEGIFVEAQKSSFMEATGGKGLYITTLNTYTREIAYNDLTQPFVTEFVKRYNTVPLYTAATYDGVNNLKTAIEKAQSLDAEALIPVMENTEFIGTAAVKAAVYPKDSSCPKCAHDLVYGPGYATGICSQWQSADPIMGQKCIWPQPFDGSTAEWKDVKYPGTYPYMIPPLVMEAFKGEAQAAPPPEQPAAPPTEQPAAPPAAGQLSFTPETYTNTDVGFTIQYPKDWKRDKAQEKPPVLVRAVNTSAPVPVLSVSTRTQDTYTEALKAGIVEAGGSSIKIGPEQEITLPDGNKAVKAKADWTTSTGFPGETLGIGVKKGDQWISCAITTVALYQPYDEAKFMEVLNTLTFTK